MKIKVFRWIIYFCLYSVLITPLLVWGKLLFPYISPKTFFFRIAIEIALFFYILLALSYSKYRPRFSKLTWLILIYLFLITVASILGFDFYHSFWGNIERGEGLLTIYHLFVFFILITSLFRKKRDWFRFFNVSILVSLLTALYALGQKFEFSFLLVGTGGSRLTGTIGNASFLAAYLLIHIFLCLFLLVQESKKWRILYGSIFLFEIYVLFQTETRGAVLGLLAGFLLMAFLSTWFSKSRKIKLFFVGLFIFLIVLAGLVWVSRDQAWVQNNSMLNRLTSISLTDTTTQTRLLGWQSAWQGWQDRFVFGYGYENYNIAFNKYFPALIYRDFDSKIWFDRAHNIIFDQAVTGGLLGLLAYLSILGFAFWILWSKTKLFNNLGYIILLSLLAAYFIQNLFVFDTLGTYLLFYSILGFVVYLSRFENEEKEEISDQNSNRLKPFSVIILVLLLVFSMYVFNLKPLWSNTISVKGLSYTYNGMYQEAMVEFKKALGNQTYQAPEIRHNLVRTVAIASAGGRLSQRENKENFDYAISETEKNIEMSPFDARHYLFAMILYNSAAKINPDYYDQVIQLGESALELSPTRPQFYFTMGQARISQKRYQEGIDYFKKAVELNPAVIESHWNLAAAYLMTDQEQLAQEEFSKIEEMGFNYYSVENLQKLSSIYRQIGRIDKVEELKQYLENK